MLVKRKENKNHLSGNTFLTLSRIEIEGRLKKMYPIGCVVDQNVAYGSLGQGRLKIKSDVVSIHTNEDNRTNISIGSVGVWHSDYKKFAKRVE